MAKLIPALLSASLLLSAGAWSASSHASELPGSFRSGLDDDAGLLTQSYGERQRSIYIGGLGSPGTPASAGPAVMDTGSLARHSLLWVFSLLGVPLLFGARPLFEALRDSPSSVPAAAGGSDGVLLHWKRRDRKEPPTRRAA